MIVRRVLLVVFGVGAVCGYALLPIAGMRSVPGSPASPLFGVAGMLVTFSALGALVTAFRQAEALNRDPGSWGLASFLFPAVAPFVLASRQRATFKPGRAAQRKIRVIGNEIVVRTGVFSSVRLPLGGLRLLTLSAPAGETRWKWKPALGPLAFESRSGVEFHELDLMAEGDGRTLLAHYRRLFEELKDKKGFLLPDRRRLEIMTSVKLQLKGYDTTEVQVTFKDILCASDDILAALDAARPIRVQRLQAWLATRPEVTVGNSLLRSGRAVLGFDGIRCGKETLPWQGVKSVGISEGSIEIELREPRSRWARTWTIGVEKKSTMKAAAEFFFWLHVDHDANADSAAAAQQEQLVAVLDGKGMCTGCKTIHDVEPGGLSACCQKTELRFRQAQRNQTCSRCGTGLSDETFGIDTKVGDLLARHGFICEACGLPSCLGCAATDAADDARFTCPCSGPLAIRL